MSSDFERWVGNRNVKSLGTNAGAAPIAFQGWHHFKEAFPPELIRNAIRSCDPSPVGILDPFGGSGTTALAAQFLGISSTTVEVNPFLVDVIRAKLEEYDAKALDGALTRICRSSQRAPATGKEVFGFLPPTFLEPGKGGRWLFDREVWLCISQLRSSIEDEEELVVRRFFRVILGGILVEVSNARVSGKGRRYRSNWASRKITASSVRDRFVARCSEAIADVRSFGVRARVKADVVHGDSRQVRPEPKHSLAVFSPPYPNSFDYTDVYNIELWMLGYLSDFAGNRTLREATLSSHVQLRRDFAEPPRNSDLLNETLMALGQVSDSLWSKWIPAMIGAYFADMNLVLANVRSGLVKGGRCWIVVGDSRYAGVEVPTGRILVELAMQENWRLVSNDAFRSMTSSAQQGSTALDERLVVLELQD